MPERILQLLLDYCQDEIEQCNKLDLVLFLRTTAVNKPLIDYLREREPDTDPIEMRVKYRRLRQRRNRFVKKIRSKLSRCNVETAAYLRTD